MSGAPPLLILSTAPWVRGSIFADPEAACPSPLAPSAFARARCTAPALRFGGKLIGGSTEEPQRDHLRPPFSPSLFKGLH